MIEGHSPPCNKLRRKSKFKYSSHKGLHKKKEVEEVKQSSISDF